MIEGWIVNLRAAQTTSPNLRIALRGSDGGELYVWTARAPRRRLERAERVRFAARLRGAARSGERCYSQICRCGDQGDARRGGFMSGARQVKILLDEKTIAERIAELAREIAAAEPRDLLVVAILKGSFMFAADLLRALHRVGLQAARRIFSSFELSSGEGLLRRRHDPEGYRIIGGGSGCPTDRRHSGIGSDARLRQGFAGCARGAARSGLLERSSAKTGQARGRCRGRLHRLRLP